jgi:hypothetical protein
MAKVQFILQTYFTMKGSIMKMDLNKVAKWSRILVLVGLLIWVTYESYMHQVLGGGKAPSIHALCPYGALESLYTLLLTGSFIKKIYSGTVVLLVLTVALAVLFRRSFCGLLCPFGALQEVFAKLGQKIFKKRFIIPQKIDQIFRYLKYVVLVLTVGMAWYYGSLWMAPYDPYAAFSHISVISSSIEEDPLVIFGFILLRSRVHSFMTAFSANIYVRQELFMPSSLKSVRLKLSAMTVFAFTVRNVINLVLLILRLRKKNGLRRQSASTVTIAFWHARLKVLLKSKLPEKQFIP